MEEFSHLSPVEYEKIVGVLKRDRDLRSVEEARIRQLKQELTCLRRRAALTPGIDPSRICARCRSELGRIINRGALCPLCHKKVCKSCRLYGEENHEWLCVFCFKQLQLKAISGEWMQEFNRLSIRRRTKDPPGDQLRRVLHESQRKELLELKTSPESASELPPKKPLRLFQCDTPQNSQQKPEDSNQEINELGKSPENISNAKSPVIEPNLNTELPPKNIENSSSTTNRFPKVLPRVSPWSGIEPEPTIPLRLVRLGPLGSLSQVEYSETLSFRERQSSDEAHYAMDFCTQSTSSEIMDDTENYSPVPSPRQRLTPLKKQRAVPEPVPVDTQQSSVDTNDSGVFSPGPKLENLTDIPTVPSTPLQLTRFSSVGHEADSPLPVHPPFAVQHLFSESSLSETDEERQHNRKSRVVFRKVALKKKKSVSLTRSLEEKRSCGSADRKPVSQTGLANPLLKKHTFNSSSKTNTKKIFASSHSYLSNAALSNPKKSGCGGNIKSNTCLPVPLNIKTIEKACEGIISFTNLEAQSDDSMSGSNRNSTAATRLADVRNAPRVQVCSSKKSFIPKRICKKNLTVFEDSKVIGACAVDCNKTVPTDKPFDPVVSADFLAKPKCNSLQKKKRKIHSRTKFYNREHYTDLSYSLVRSMSVPSLKTFSEDCLQPWLCQPLSLEDWLWYLEEQPINTRSYKKTANILPDDYKLVYVSSSSSADTLSSESESDVSTENSSNEVSLQDHLRVHSRIETNYGISYIEDSDWELNSDTSDEHFCASALLECEESKLRINEAKNYSVQFFSPTDEGATSTIELDNLVSISRANATVDFHNFAKNQFEILSELLKVKGSCWDAVTTDALRSSDEILCRSTSNMELIYKPTQSKLSNLSNRNLVLVFMENLSAYESINIRASEHHCLKERVEKGTANVISLASYSQNITHQTTNLPFPSAHAGVIDLAHNAYSQFTFTLPSSANHCSQIVSANICGRPMDVSRDYIVHHDRIPFSNIFNDGIVCTRPALKLESLDCFPGFASVHIYPACFLFEFASPLLSTNFTQVARTQYVPQKFYILIEPVAVSTNESTDNEGQRTKMALFFLNVPDVIAHDILNPNNFLYSQECVALDLQPKQQIQMINKKDFRVEKLNSNCWKYKFLFRKTGTAFFFETLSENNRTEEVWNLPQLGNANASYFSAFLPYANPAPRCNDKPATGWRKRCCIASATQVIDLNLGALECGREVLDSTNLTPFTGWTVFSRSLQSFASKFESFFQDGPPVAAEPEVANAFHELTAHNRSCVLLSPRRAVYSSRMYASQTANLGVSEIKSPDDETGKYCAEKICSAMQSKENVHMDDGKMCDRIVSVVDDANTLDECEKMNLQSKISDTEFDQPCRNTENNTGLPKMSDVSRNCRKLSHTNMPNSLHDSSNFVANHEQSSHSKCDDFCDAFFLSDILPFMRYIFCDEYTHFNNFNHNTRTTADQELQLPIAPIESERVDCNCYKPCEVPSSPSVLDITFDKMLLDDGEIFSSGDELDKLESDTDSQDTVIEGEAYKRIRSVAIKEKILHANEVLFGSTRNSMSCSENAAASDSNLKFIKPNIYSERDSSLGKIREHNSIDNVSSNESDLGSSPNSDKSDSLITISSLEDHLYACQNYNHPNLSFTSEKDNVSVEKNGSRNYELSSYNLSETLCSSESSDNGSDGEEIILSDTSSSSDEATYIASSAGFRYYNYPSSYRLHTIMEESCEESEKSSRRTTPSGRNSADFEYFDKLRSSFSRSPRKMNGKSLGNSNVQSSNTDSNSTVYAALASSRLEKYFKSGLLEGKHTSCPEDDLTDESGGISSDEEDKTAFKRNERISKTSHGKLLNNKLSHLSKVKKENNDSKNASTSKSLSVYQNNNFELGACALPTMSLTGKESFGEISTNLPESQSQIKAKNFHSVDNENVSDDEAKYIMSHLMQHITNNNEANTNVENSDLKDTSPMLKILESEIARLMLTVSPASLSAGEPSSSCSSTIGSNNSDYGSDTLESGDESTSEEDLNENLEPENSSVLSIPAPTDPVASTSAVEQNSAENVLPLESSTSDSIVSEETLYICKQLMASLKKIADTTEGQNISDNVCADESEDHTAKQYITEQIVSLMQTVNASQNNSPLLQRFAANQSPVSHIDSDVSQERSDSDSPQPNDEKRGRSKSKTPSESGSETTFSASISIPSYDDSDRTPTESEISHEMDELYALLENNGAPQDAIASKFSYDLDSCGLDEGVSVRSSDSGSSDDDYTFKFSNSCEGSTSDSTGSSLLCGAASKLESLLPITIEERIARYKDAFLNRSPNSKTDHKSNETRINVILPQPSVSSSELNLFDKTNSTCSCIDGESYTSSFMCSDSKESSLVEKDFENLSSNSYLGKNEQSNYNIFSVKIISHNTYPPSSAIHKILSNKIDSTYLDKKIDYKIVNVLDDEEDKDVSCKTSDDNILPVADLNDIDESSITETSSIISPMPKVMNPKEKASSENDLLVADYRAKSKNNKVFGTKSVGNISELENINNKNTFRDTGYYSFKSSEESFLSLDDSTASQTSTASLTQYRSLTSTETIPEEEESSSKTVMPTKMSLSSGNIPDAVCDNSGAKSSTLPLSLRNKLSTAPGGNHRTRSSFFSTSGVLRKLTMLRDESGNSLRSSPHGRLRMRNRSLSGGSEEERHRKSSIPQIAVLECTELNQIGKSSATSSERDSSVQEDDLDQVFAYHSRSQMSLSSFGGRSESVTSVYSAAGGGRYGTVAVTGEVLFSIGYNYKTGTLEINIKECRNLAPVEIKRNRSDPYVKIYLLPDRTKSGKRKTKVKKHTLSPVFDELLKFQVTASELETRTLWLSVWHSDRFGRNDFLGEVMLPLGYDTFENPGLKWYPLQERLETLDMPISYKGDLILALKYVPPDVTSRKHPKKPGDQAKGALHVLVREARNVMATRSNGTSDPFCKSYLLPDKSKSGKQKTPVFKKSCNPKWNHTFVYEDVTVNELKERCLELTIWDYDKITSNDFLGGVRLCLGTGKFQGRDVEWMDSVGEEISLWYTMLERPNTWVDGSLLLRPSMQSRKTT